jgi:ElaB/YqjD/DUF883 family membrane-anchored ribosome-binding protein
MSAGYPTGTSSHSEEQKGLREKAQEMASSVSETAGQMTEKAREYASGIAGQAQETWRSAREGLQEGYSAVAERAGDLWGDTTELIRRYPLAALGIAFGLGCLAGCALNLMPRSDDMTRRMSRSSS